MTTTQIRTTQIRTTLWAALSANGNYALNNPEHPPKREALSDFGAHVHAIGNFIVGRRTYEAFGAGGGENPFGEIDIVVVSRESSEIPGAIRARSPHDALAILAEKGHQQALIAGGESLHNAFLAEDLVDELVFNMTPIMEGKGSNILLPEGTYRDTRLLESKEIGGGIVQIRYALNRTEK